MTMSGDDVSTSVVQRFEVFTGSGRRREWPAEVKASIVAESYSGRESVSSVARRHGIAAGQLFSWRRDLRKQMEARGVPTIAAEPAPSFVPAVVERLPQEDPVRRRTRSRRRSDAGMIELEIDGVAVRIGRGADVKLIGAVIDALRPSR